MSRILPEEIMTHNKQKSVNSGTGKAADFQWRKMDKRQLPLAEKLLRDRELWCVAACGRFNRLLKQRSSTDAVWTLRDNGGGIYALIVYANYNLLPVFCGNTEIPNPVFINKIFGMLPIHSIQGLRDEAIFIEDYLSTYGLAAVDKIDYNLMYIDVLPELSSFNTGPKSLILRSARNSDLDALAVLQAGYEQEEVLPSGAVFNPASSRLNTEKIFGHEQLLVAELEGRLVGKINTSALSFTRFQIGGVYVLPAFRGMGIARRMAGEFVSGLIKQGKGVSLFVKKSNPPAISVYRRLGFKFLADYRITYY